MELKRCTKCGENKPSTNEYFSYTNKSKGKLKTWCKVCDKEYQKEYRENNKDTIKEKNKVYRENNKDKIREYKKEYRENNKDKIREGRKVHYENNKDKVREGRKVYYENNKDTILEKNKVYYENNKDKVREWSKRYQHKKRGNGGSYTKAQWLDALEYFDYKCAYTGECIKHSCDIEHIVPISKGGTSYIWNLVPSTKSANCSKHNRDMEEWYKEQEYFCEERLNKILEYQKIMAAKYKK